MHKKNRSKKGPRHPPQSDTTKVSSIVPETSQPTVTEIEENKNEERVPDPNPEPISDLQSPVVIQIETAATDIPPKPKRHRAGRKKKQAFEKNQSNKEVVSEETTRTSEVSQESAKSQINVSEETKIICEKISSEILEKESSVKETTVISENIENAFANKKEMILSIISSDTVKNDNIVSTLEHKSLSGIRDIASTNIMGREEIKPKTIDPNFTISQDIIEEEKLIEEVLTFPTVAAKNEPKAKGRGKKSKSKSENKSECEESIPVTELLHQDSSKELLETKVSTRIDDDNKVIKNKSATEKQSITEKQSFDKLEIENKSIQNKHFATNVSSITSQSTSTNIESAYHTSKKSDKTIQKEVNLESMQQVTTENVVKDTSVHTGIASNVKNKNPLADQLYSTTQLEQTTEVKINENPIKKQDILQHEDISLSVQSAENSSKEFTLNAKTSQTIDTRESMGHNQECFSKKGKKNKSGNNSLKVDKITSQYDSTITTEKSAGNESKEVILTAETAILQETMDLKQSNQESSIKKELVENVAKNTTITEGDNLGTKDICLKKEIPTNISKEITSSTKSRSFPEPIGEIVENQKVITEIEKDNSQREDMCSSTESAKNTSKLITMDKVNIVYGTKEYIQEKNQEKEGQNDIVKTEKDNSQQSTIFVSAKSSENLLAKNTINTETSVASKTLYLKEESQELISKTELEKEGEQNVQDFVESKIILPVDKPSVTSNLSQRLELDVCDNTALKQKSKSKKQHYYNKQHEITKEESIGTRISSDTSLSQDTATGATADFIAGLSEVLVNTKIDDNLKTEETLEETSKSITLNVISNEFIQPNISTLIIPDKQNESKKFIIPNIINKEKEPLLMICDKTPSASIVKSTKEIKSSINIDNKTETLCVKNINPGLKIAEEIAESIKEELKCQLAIISGSSDNKLKNQMLIEQKIEDIADETEKNVVKNIECVMKTVEPSCPKSTENISTDSFGQLSPKLSDDIIESEKSNDKNVNKGKGKSKKGSKKDKVDSHASVQLSSEQTSSVQAPSTTQNTDKSTKDTEKQSDHKSDSQSSSTNKQTDNNAETKKRPNDANTGDNTDFENNKDSESIESKRENEDKNIYMDVGKDLPVSLSGDRNNSLADFEYIAKCQDASGNQKDSKDDEQQSKVIHPKNLLGLPNIPVSSSKTDYKKEKNKSDEIMDRDIARSKLFLTREENLPETKEKKETGLIQLNSSDSVSKLLPESICIGSKQTNKKIKHSQHHNESDEEFVYKYKFRNVYLANACNFCKKQIQEKRSLCGYCNLISYCNDSHKKIDWPEHQPMCYSVTTIMQINGLKHLYSKSQTLSGQEYRILRMQMIVLCEKLLKRKLLPSEQEVLLYPRLCLKQECREWQSDKLQECDACGQVSYCKNFPDHLTVDHEKWCRSYKIYYQLVAHQLEKGKVEPKLPNRILPYVYNLTENCSNLMEELYNNNIDMDDINFATLTQLSTAPLTALYAYQLWKLNCDPKDNIMVPNEMTIHVVGAELQFEVDTLNKWEAFFLHLFPSLKQLNLEFIGPELNASNIPLDLLSRIRLCKSCRETGINITVEFKDGILYHDYANGATFNKPNLVCAFNPGLHRTTGFAGQDTWPDTIRSIISLAVPFCVTSYTSQELPRDLTRVLSCCPNDNIKTYVAPRLNPYASLRPDRNFISDDEMPLIFKNYYFMVLSGLPA